MSREVGEDHFLLAFTLDPPAAPELCGGQSSPFQAPLRRERTEAQTNPEARSEISQGTASLLHRSLPSGRLPGGRRCPTGRGPRGPRAGIWPWDGAPSRPRRQGTVHSTDGPLEAPTQSRKPREEGGRGTLPHLQNRCLLSYGNRCWELRAAPRLAHTGAHQETWREMTGGVAPKYLRTNGGEVGRGERGGWTDAACGSHYLCSGRGSTPPRERLHQRQDLCVPVPAGPVL